MRRFRRLRKNSAIRKLVRETSLSVDDFIYPLFAVEGEGIKREISSLPDVYHFSVDEIVKETAELVELGIDKLLIFGVPDEKDEYGREAYDDEGIVQRTVRAIKAAFPDVYVITDVCMCQYTSHGHCGILADDGTVINDVTLEYLSRIAISHARAGADMVAPSDMMDGRIAHMRKSLDDNGYEGIPIMSYSAKFASSYYGPFRVAASSSPKSGDRKSYQMDFHNSDEAMRVIASDIEAGADIVMVKPALSYLDIIRRAKDTFNIPIAAYNVSGEYAMIVNAVRSGAVNESIIYETLLSMKRAGADIIITYFAKSMAKELRRQDVQ